MQDVDKTFISQYAQSPTIRRMVNDFNAYLDPTQSLDQFYELIWNVDTAVGYGLDVWGRIVGVGRVLQVNIVGYRVLVKAKALANICDGSIPAINQILLLLFPGRGNCYVADGDMLMTYTFEFPLTPVEGAIVAQSGILPRTAGVTQFLVGV
jgi:hypothetical protein